MEKEQDLGALWIKTSSKGEFLSGTIEVNGEKINIVCFTNQNKKEARHPDWRILKSKPKQEIETQNNPNPEMADDGIPF